MPSEHTQVEEPSSLNRQLPSYNPDHPLTLSYVKGIADAYFPAETIGEAFSRIVRKHPDRDALVSVEQGIRLTWLELESCVNALAMALSGRGLKKGDRVGIWAMNCSEWVIVQLATAKLGMILVTINPAYRVEELRHALLVADCSAIFVGPSYKGSDFAAMLATVRSSEAVDAPAFDFLVIDIAPDCRAGLVPWSELLLEGATWSHDALSELSNIVRDHEPINIQFTSGTTGAPKGVTLSHRNILNNAWYTGLALGISANDRLCLPVPLFHCFGMVTGILMCVTHGAALVLPAPGFDASATLQAIAQESCSALYGVPTMYLAMFNHPEFDESRFHSMRTGIMAGSLCPESLIEAAMTRMNMRDIAICYGMTEAPVSFQTSISDPVVRKLQTVGRIQPHIEAKLVDVIGETVAIGTVGEICVRGYNTMLGYWKNEQATADTIDNEGWLRTGDLGILDTEGYLRIVGRCKDMVIRGGENLYPKEIEEFLYRHDEINDIQVFGVADEKYGEELCAWIIRVEGSSLDERNVRAYCRDRIAHHKVPRYIRFVESFPMTASGKVQKAVLRTMMEKQLVDTK